MLIQDITLLCAKCNACGSDFNLLFLIHKALKRINICGLNFKIVFLNAI